MAQHGQDGWYIGPALEHYRCYTVYITKTRGDRIVETVEFFQKHSPYHFPHPKIWQLRLQGILLALSYIHNLPAYSVRLATHKQLP
jgi:hypothetical protein